MGCCIPKRVVRGVVIGAIVADFRKETVRQLNNYSRRLKNKVQPAIKMKET